MTKKDSDRRKHWDDVYSGKKAHETSWHQELPGLSLSMLAKAGLDHHASLIDIGGGASLLVDHLLELGCRDLTVLDISAAALEQARERLGNRASWVEWVVGDVTRYEPDRTFDLWHDRAAFHFLTSAEDRKHYVQVLCKALKPGGQAIIAAFALDGPEKCSGLDVVRYDGMKLSAELGPRLQLLDHEFETHITPAKREQRFGFYRFRRMG